MSEQGDADCAASQQMRNGVRALTGVKHILGEYVL
jgi:hypothetical protein